MLVKLSELLVKLYADDWQSVFEALRVIKCLDSITIEQVAEVIVNGKVTHRPIFCNPSIKTQTVNADDKHLKLIASHIKQKTDLVNSLMLVGKIEDVRLNKLAQLIGKEREALVSADRTNPSYEFKPFLALMHSSRRKDLTVESQI